MFIRTYERNIRDLNIYLSRYDIILFYAAEHIKFFIAYHKYRHQKTLFLLNELIFDDLENFEYENGKFLLCIILTIIK